MKSKILFLFLAIVSQSFSQVDTAVALYGDIKTKPGLLWKFKTNGPVVGSPVIGGSTVFVTSLDSTLYALDLTTGNLVWKHSTAAPIRSSVCLGFDYVFLLGGEGILYTIRQDSGQVYGYFRTQTGIMGERQNDYADYYQSTPVIADTIIYFGSGGFIYAIDMKKWSMKWRYETGDVVHTNPVVSNGRVYAGSNDGNLYSIDAYTGNLVWKFKTTGHSMFPKGEVTGNPVIAKGMVYAGARDFNFYAVDETGGYCNWLKQFPKGWAMPATINDSVIYVGTSDDRQLFAYNLLSGAEIWKADAGFNILGGCAIGSKMGYFGTLCGKVHGIDLTTGKILWTIELESYKKSHLLWLKPDDSYRDDISKLILTPPDLLTMYKQLGGVYGTPIVSGDRLVVAGYDGWVYCFSSEIK